MGNDVEVKVGANVESAEDAFRALGAEAQQSLAGIGSEGEKVSGRLAALDKLWDSPARLGKAAALAKLDLENLSQSVEKAGRMTPELARHFEDAGKKIDAAAGRARAFGDVAGDLRTKGDLAAKGFEAAASSAGSLEGILGNLKDTGSQGQQKLADMGFAAIGMAAAFKMGYDAGKQLDEGLKSVGVNIAKLFELNPTGFFADLGLAMGKVIPIGDANTKMLKEMSSATSQFAGLMDPLPTRINPVIAALHAHQAAAAAAAEDAKRFGITLVQVGDAATTLALKGKALEDFFSAHRKGAKDVTDLGAAVKQNSGALLQYRDEWIQSGKAVSEMPPKMRALVEAAEAAAAATETHIKKQELFRQSATETIPALTTLAARYAATEQGIVEYVKTGGNAAEADRRQKEARAELARGLEDFARENGLTMAEVQKLVTATNDLTKAGKDAEDPVNRVKTVLNELAKEAGDAAGKVKEVGDKLKDIQPAASHAQGPLELVAGHIKDLGKSDPVIANIKATGVEIFNLAGRARETDPAISGLSIKFNELGDAVVKVSRSGGTARQFSDEWSAAHQVQLAEVDRMVAAYERLEKAVEAKRRAEQKAAEEAVASAEAQRAALDGISNHYIGVVGQAKVLVFEITKATDEALAQLDRVSDKFANLNDKARDYAATIIAAYQSGFTDFFTTLTALSDTINQLNTLLMRNAGTQFAAGIREILDAYIELRRQLTSGEIRLTEKMKLNP